MDTLRLISHKGQAYVVDTEIFESFPEYFSSEVIEIPFIQTLTELNEILLEEKEKRMWSEVEELIRKHLGDEYLPFLRDISDL